MAQQRLQTSWYTAHHSSCSSSFALLRCSGIYSSTAQASRAVRSSRTGVVVRVNAQLKRACLLRCSTDGGAAAHGPAAAPDQLARSASLVLVI